MKNKSLIKNIAVSAASFVPIVYIMYKFAGVNSADYGVFSLLAFCGIYCFSSAFFDKQPICVNRFMLWAISVLFSYATITGYYFTNLLPYAEMSTKDAVFYFVCIFGYTFLAKCIFTAIFTGLERWAAHYKLMPENALKTKNWQIWLFAFVVIMVCWTVVWLAYYPGLWNYDPEQVHQVLNGEYNKHHPLIHTLFLGGCYLFGLNMGNENLGVILHSFIQMSFMAGVFAYSYLYIRRHFKGWIIAAATLVFFALFPINPILAISTTKDIIFTGLVLLCFILALQLMQDNNSPKANKIYIAVLFVSAVLMMLFRNNGIYAFAIAAMAAAAMFKVLKNSKKILLFMIVCIAAYKGSDMALTGALGAVNGSIGEMLSLPSQQFGSVFLAAEKENDIDTMLMVEEFYDLDKAKYTPYLSDYMKLYLRNIDRPGGMSKYLKTSLELFKRYPLETIDAVVYVTQGNWDINDISHSQIYGCSLKYRMGYLITRVEKGYGITHESKLPFVEGIYERLIVANYYRLFPVVSLLFAPAIYLWILAAYTMVMIKTKDRGNLFLSMFFWGYMLTVFAGPCVIIRYTYPLIVATPIFIINAVKVVSEYKMEKNNG